MGDVSYRSDQSLAEQADTAVEFPLVARMGVHRGAISGIAAGSDGTLMVANHADNSVSWIDTQTRTCVRTTVGINEPFAVAIAGTRAYVSTVSATYDAIVVIDVNTGSVVEEHPVAHSIRDLTISPDGRYVYACRTAVHGADVAVLDTMTGHVDSIGLTADAAETGASTVCVRVSPDGARLYVATDGPSGAELAVISTRRHRVTGAVRVGSPIRDIALSPDGDTAYVVSCGSDFGAVLDVVDTATNKITHTGKISQVNGLGTQLALSADGERAYLVSDQSVVVLSTRTHDVIGAVAVGCQPSCVMESPDGNQLYVADYAGTVSVVATSATTGYAVVPDEWTVPLAQLQLA